MFQKKWDDPLPTGCSTKFIYIAFGCKILHSKQNISKVRTRKIVSLRTINNVYTGPNKINTLFTTNATGLK